MKTFLYVIGAITLTLSTLAAMAGALGAAWGILMGSIYVCTGAIIGAIEATKEPTKPNGSPL